jgi:hypothetical protein
MMKFLLTTAAALMLSTGLAAAQDASTTEAPAQDAAATTLPQPVDQAPPQTTVIVPAARDAITNDVVPAEVPKQEEPESLRDKVRSKMEE